MKPSFMKQTDSHWASKSFKCTDDSYASVEKVECDPSCIANIADALIKSITPPHRYKLHNCNQKNIVNSYIKKEPI